MKRFLDIIINDSYFNRIDYFDLIIIKFLNTDDKTYNINYDLQIKNFKHKLSGGFNYKNPELSFKQMIKTTEPPYYNIWDAANNHIIKLIEEDKKYNHLLDRIKLLIS